jgi:hypothetical protein
VKQIGDVDLVVPSLEHYYPESKEEGAGEVLDSKL